MTVIAAGGFVAATVGAVRFARAVGREKGWILRWIAVAATAGLAILTGASELEAVSGDPYIEALLLAFLVVPVTLAMTGGGMARFCHARGASVLGTRWLGVILACLPSILLVGGIVVTQAPGPATLPCMVVFPFAWVGQISCATIAMRRTARVMREGTWDAQQEEPPTEPAGPPSAPRARVSVIVRTLRKRNGKDPTWHPSQPRVGGFCGTRRRAWRRSASADGPGRPIPSMARCPRAPSARPART